MTRVISSSLERVSRSVRSLQRPVISAWTRSPGSRIVLTPRPSRPCPASGLAGFVPGYSCGAAPAWHRLPSCPGGALHASRSSSSAPSLGARGHEALGERGIRGEVKMHVAHERTPHDVSLRVFLTVAPAHTVGARDRVGGRVDPRVVELVAPRHDTGAAEGDRKSTRLNSSHDQISYAVFCLKKKKKKKRQSINKKKKQKTPYTTIKQTNK